MTPHGKRLLRDARLAEEAKDLDRGLLEPWACEGRISTENSGRCGKLTPKGRHFARPRTPMTGEEFRGRLTVLLRHLEASDIGQAAVAAVLYGRRASYRRR